jgi:chemotaxis signal transduction protein
LGLVGVRGVVAPIYDLAQLLGYASVAAPRWVALLRGSAPFGVAFERFERHLRVPTSDVTLAAAPHDATSATLTFGSVRSESGPLPLIDLFALFRAVTNGPEPSSEPKREDAP